jgi:hypothetical protein
MKGNADPLEASGVTISTVAEIIPAGSDQVPVTADVRADIVRLAGRYVEMLVLPRPWFSGGLWT